MFPWNSDIYLRSVACSKNAKGKRVIVRVFELLKRTEDKTAGVFLYFFPMTLFV